MIKVQNISKSFKNGFSLKDVSFNIENKDVIALVGDNGCGKTTILKCLTGEYTIKDGKITNDQGNPLSREERMKIGFFNDSNSVPLVRNPNVIFFDEPTANMDVKAKIEVMELIEELSQKNDIAILITSHIIEELQQLCNKLVLVNDGDMIQSMSIKEEELIELKDNVMSGFNAEIGSEFYNSLKDEKIYSELFDEEKFIE
ncbi:hypothetical protein FQR65_LT20968 [Abscondita terminalis]|nr:hypothetical protein FQR65_LT20968 [Abscondita terminalis]